jgi:AraC family transcriptional activator of mtrCDE
MLRISASDLDRLLSTLEVAFVGLSKCLVGAGHRLELANDIDAPAIHYNLMGAGKALIGRDQIDLSPHTLMVIPARRPISIEASRVRGRRLKVVDGHCQTAASGGIQKFVAGEGEPEIIVICGYIHATYGSSIDLFETLASPIVEQFAVGDQIDHKLDAALAELITQEIGSGAMSAALLKQVIVALLRRSLNSVNLWVERFSMLSDAQIARAFSQMAAHPGAPHTVESLARDAALSRSAFMSRFTRIVGRPPMFVLRDLRMRQAARQLTAGALSVEEIAHATGYESRSSFVRAFRKAFGCDPTEHRALRKAAPGGAWIGRSPPEKSGRLGTNCGHSAQEAALPSCGWHRAAQQEQSHVLGDLRGVARAKQDECLSISAHLKRLPPRTSKW